MIVKKIKFGNDIKDKVKNTMPLSCTVLDILNYYLAQHYYLITYFVNIQVNVYLYYIECYEFIFD